MKMLLELGDVVDTHVYVRMFSCHYFFFPQEKVGECLTRSRDMVNGCYYKIETLDSVRVFVFHDLRSMMRQEDYKYYLICREERLNMCVV